MMNKMNDNGAGPTDAGTDVRKREKEMERERERIMKQMCGGECYFDLIVHISTFI